MHRHVILFITASSLCVFAIGSNVPAEKLPTKQTARHAKRKTPWSAVMATTIKHVGTGGGYACTGQALNNFINAFRLDDEKGPIIRPATARPSFCSSAVYMALLLSLSMWDAENAPPVLTRQTWQALFPKRQGDGIGPWGYANANGPGLALLVHELRAGHSFIEWERAQAGDIMKLWWTEAIGAHERGHLTIYLSHTKDSVTFWSSNQFNPQENPGYGVKTVPKSTVKHILFTRITKPEAFVNAPSIKINKWLGTLLKTDITPAEMHRCCGIYPPPAISQP